MKKDAKQAKKLGHLQMCVDKRYVHVLQKKFEEATGLSEGEYWMHTDAGGSPKMENNSTAPDFAFSKGARLMAWCAHGSWCGGYGGEPAGVTDDQIKADLTKTFYRKVHEYPEATHWAFFITGEGDKMTISELGPKTLSQEDPWTEGKPVGRAGAGQRA